MQTWQDAIRYGFSPDGTDTTRHISDDELARAIIATGNLLSAAMLLSEAHGRIVARSDIAARVDASRRRRLGMRRHGGWPAGTVQLPL
jgi:hypothetical protein